MIEDYVRNAKLIRVVDGDTLELDIDVGFRIWIKQRVRVLGVNCPETKGETLMAGLSAKKATQDWLERAKIFQVRTHLDKTDSFGRILAEVWIENESLADYLLTSGNAVLYQ